MLLVLSRTRCLHAGVRAAEGAEFAAQARLIDTIDIQRTNQRLLSRQAQVCLVSDAGGTSAGANLLRAMQAGFNGHFLAVGVESEPMDYSARRGPSRRVRAHSTCSMYSRRASCSVQWWRPDVRQPPFNSPSLVVSNGDRSLVDRINVTIKHGVIPESSDNAERLQKAFTELAIALTGGAIG